MKCVIYNHYFVFLLIFFDSVFYCYICWVESNSIIIDVMVTEVFIH